MMDVITGKTRPDKGAVVFGKATDLTRLDEAAIANLGIGRKFQKPTVFEQHTVTGNSRWPWRRRAGSGRRCAIVGRRPRKRASTRSWR